MLALVLKKTREIPLRCKVNGPCISASFTKGNNLHDSLIASMDDKARGSTLNPIALRAAKTLWGFGHSECNRVKGKNLLQEEQKQILFFKSRLPTERGDKKENCRVASPESACMHTKGKH